MGHDVFISYSSKDRKAAEDLYRALEAGKVRVWIAPRDLAPSSTWAAAIPAAIESSRLVILLFSKHSDASEWVPREIEHAVSSKRRIMMVRLTDAEPSSGLKFILKTLHWLDAFPGALQQHLPNITRQSQQLLDIRPEPRPAPAASKKPAAPQKVAAPAPAEPAWRRPQARLAAAAIFAALLLAVGGGVYSLQAPKPIAKIADPPTIVSVAAGACSSSYDDQLAQPSMKDFELPENDGWAGAYTVVDVSTLKVRDKIIKLSRVGQGDLQGASNLRYWLEAAGPTIVCKPADERRCRYTCENEAHLDLSEKILSSNWATPVATSVSSQN